MTSEFKQRIREEFILIEDLIKIANEEYEKDKIDKMLNCLYKAKKRIDIIINAFI